MQHEILGKIRHTQQADYPNFRGNVAALKAHFIRLAKMGQALTDDFKRYFLLEGLAEDFRRGMHGTILAYETPDGRPCSYEKAVQLLTSWGDGQSSTSQRGRPDTAMPVQSAHQQVVRSPCLQFSRRGRCKWGKACRFLHVDAQAQACTLARANYEDAQASSVTEGKETFSRSVFSLWASWPSQGGLQGERPRPFST